MFRKSRIEMNTESERFPKRSIPEFETLHTVATIPVVELFLTKASDGYEKVKNSNELVKWYLSTTEATVCVLANAALPLVKRPLKALDGFTAKGVDVLRKKIPAVNTPPEQVVVKTQTFCQTSLEALAKNAKAVKEYSAEKAIVVGKVGLNTTNYILDNPAGKCFLFTINTATDVIQCSIIDRILPKSANESENPEYIPEDHNELAKSLNKILNIFYSVLNRCKRRRDIFNLIESLIDDTKNICDDFITGINRIRRKEIEEVFDILHTRDMIKMVWSLTKAADVVNAALSPDLFALLEKCQKESEEMTEKLGKTGSVKDLSYEDALNLKERTFFIRSSMVKIFEGAKNGWSKLEPEALEDAVQVYAG